MIFTEEIITSFATGRIYDQNHFGSVKELHPVQELRQQVSVVVACKFTSGKLEMKKK